MSRTLDLTDRKAVIAEAIRIDSELCSIGNELARLKHRRTDLIERKRKLCDQTLFPDALRNAVLGEFDNDDFPWIQKAQSTLENVFKHKSFRPLQKAVINSVMSKSDALVTMYPGAGKSLCYQLPAVLLGGLTLVISPLVSLIEDQMAHLRKLGIEVATLNQEISKDEEERVEDELLQKKSKITLLYVTPQKLLKSKRIMKILKKRCSDGHLKLIAIDEVHCCSQVGHELIKEYGYLSILKQKFINVPVIGVSSTSTIQNTLKVHEVLDVTGCSVFRSTFNRPNLHYEVIHQPSDNQEEIAEMIKTKFDKQSGIIYCLNKKDCQLLVEKLRSHGISATQYHGGLEHKECTAAYEKWYNDEIHVMVASTASFGMGIDKQNVRFVIHHRMPKSIQSYYQQTGRAGRDGEKAYCILFYRLSDLFLISVGICETKEALLNLYGVVEYAMEVRKCRRDLLLKNFETIYDRSWCSNACDICQNDEPVHTLDVTYITDVSHQFIRERQSQDNHTTGAALIEKLMEFSGKSRQTLEVVVSNLLIRNFLVEQYLFTPTLCTSLIDVGRFWEPNTKIVVDLLKKKKKNEKRTD